MQLTDILSQMGGLQSVARELGVSEGEVAAGAAALTPAMLGGFKKQAQAQPSGLDGLDGLLGQLGGGSLLDQVLAPQPTDINRGNEVLGQIFGSKVDWRRCWIRTETAIRSTTFSAWPADRGPSALASLGSCQLPVASPPSP